MGGGGGGSGRYYILMHPKPTTHPTALNFKLLPCPKKSLVARLECLSSTDVDLSALTHSNHEEADTRIFVHVADAAKQGHRSIVVRTNDSDVVILVVSPFIQLGDKIDELWLAFGVGHWLLLLFTR